MLPTQKQFAEWDSQYFDGERQNFTVGQVDVMMVEAFQGGADQQLQQVIEWLADQGYCAGLRVRLMEAMRPATKEQES